MASLDEAACLHANQIGVTHNLFAYADEKDRPHVMFNPVIKLGLAANKQVEGCFTHEEPVAVTRYDRIKVAYEELVDGKLVQRKGDLSTPAPANVAHSQANDAHASTSATPHAFAKPSPTCTNSAHNAKPQPGEPSTKNGQTLTAAHTALP